MRQPGSFRPQRWPGQAPHTMNRYLYAFTLWSVPGFEFEQFNLCFSSDDYLLFFNVLLILFEYFLNICILYYKNSSKMF